MSNTNIPLLAQDETGFGKILMPFSGMHKFRGKKVREIPIAQQGGYSAQDLYNFLFEDDEEEVTTKQPQKKAVVENTAPSEDELFQKQLQDQEEYNLALNLATQDFGQYEYEEKEKEKKSVKGYTPQFSLSNNNNPYKAGQYGQQIIQDITGALGYTPQFNSVYRTPEKQRQLINQGWGVNNSWHLTGDAIDMKPSDWNKLPKEKQAEFRNKYDVIYHNNHYHMEPRGKRKMQDGGKFERYLSYGNNKGDINTNHSIPAEQKIIEQQVAREVASIPQGKKDMRASILRPKNLPTIGNTVPKNEYEKAVFQQRMKNYWDDRGYNTDEHGQRTTAKPLQKAGEYLDKPAKMLGTMAEIGLLMSDASPVVSTLRGLKPVVNNFIDKRSLIRNHNKFYDYINNPVVIDRLQNAGMSEGAIKNMKKPTLTFHRDRSSHFNSNGDEININLDQIRALNKNHALKPQVVYDHELGHYFQKEITQNSPEFISKVHNFNMYRGLMNHLLNDPSKLSFESRQGLMDIVSHLNSYPPVSAIDETVVDKVGKYLTPREGLSMQEDLAYNYFNYNIEPLAHLREMRSNMIQKGIIKDHTSMIKTKHINQFLQNSGNDRVSSFIDANDKNNIIDLKFLLNSVPSIAPAMVGGAGVMAANKKKKGGGFNPYK